MAAVVAAGQFGRMVALRDAFITGTGVFLPGEPVGNDRMEDFIGRVGGRNSVVGQRALRWNGIESRHYALSPGGDILHSNASMSAAAVMASLQDAGLGREHLQMLATATTQGDYLVPGHASAVHGELGGGALELASFQSVCASSLMAAKAASLSVRAGEYRLRVGGRRRILVPLVPAELLRGYGSGRRQGTTADGGGFPALDPVRRRRRGRDRAETAARPGVSADRVDRSHLARRPLRPLHVGRGGTGRSRRAARARGAMPDRGTRMRPAPSRCCRISPC